MYPSADDKLMSLFLSVKVLVVMDFTLQPARATILGCSKAD